MGRVGNQDHVPVMGVVGMVIGTDHQYAGELAVRTSRGLQSDGLKTTDCLKCLLQAKH